jgi:hypothetical protein
MRRLTTVTGAVCALVIGASVVPASAHPHGSLRTVTGGLDQPRGVATVRPGVTLVSEANGTVSVVREHRHRAATVRKLTRVPTLAAPAIARGRDGTVYILTGASGGPPEEGQEPAPDDVVAASSRLFTWRPGWKKPHQLADIGAYQVRDPDPYDLEDVPADSNPFGVAALRHGGVLVSDAAGNDLLRVSRHGHISTVAVLKPRTVKVPEGVELPPGTPSEIPAEAVATSVTVGSDGYYYVGELRGFPATPGTSEIWRIRPGSHGAVCDPEKPRAGSCKRYADGLTSIVDLAPGRHGRIYALSLAKQSWLAAEMQAPGSEIGGLFQVSPWGRHVRELAKDKLVLPGGVDTGRYGGVYVVGPQIAPGGTLYKLRG